MNIPLSCFFCTETIKTNESMRNDEFYLKNFFMNRINRKTKSFNNHYTCIQE